MQACISNDRTARCKVPAQYGWPACGPLSSTGIVSVAAAYFSCWPLLNPHFVGQAIAGQLIEICDITS
jgi:hypothetical protein